VIVDQLDFAKAKSLQKGATNASFAIQDRIHSTAINAKALSKRSLTSLAFHCGSKQMNNVIIIEYAELIRSPRRL
jgi:hypothetical protein